MEQVVATFDMPPVIIGHSMGGFITQKYLEKHPETPAAVLLTAIPPSGLWPTTFKLLFEKPHIVMKVLMTLSLYPVIETNDLTRWALFSNDMPDETVKAYRSKMNDESFRAYIDELGLNLVRPKRIKTPVLVIGAQNDNVILPKMVQATARAYNTQAVMFPDMAHDVMLEAGWEKVAKRILDWLSEKGL